MKAVFAKNLRTLVPADEDAEAIIRRLGQGEMVTVEVKRPRNLQHHRLLFALLNIVWDNLDHERWPTVEDLLTEAKIVTGHYDRRDIVWEGQRIPVLTPRSINFASMSQDDFSPWFDRVCDWVCRDLIPGLDRAELQQQVEEMLGISVPG